MRTSSLPQNHFCLSEVFSPAPFGIGLRLRRLQALTLTLSQRKREREIFLYFARKFGHAVVCSALILQPVVVFAQRADQRSSQASVIINVTGRAANRFVPTHALGAGIDGHDKGVADLQLTAKNIQAMLSAGLKPLAYRLRTELANDVWHWNPQGVWSDASRRQGYWISEPESGTPISVSYGYRLPRRGNTIDQANNEGYSRLDDGDTASFWKSNPYLDRQLTGESNSFHPQWIVIEFARSMPVNAVHLFWGAPYATRYRIQYGNFDDVSNIEFNPRGMWRDFPHGVIPAGTKPRLATPATENSGGEVLIRLSRKPIMARWLRILMTESSGTSTGPSSDIRDRLGFAMREIYAGTFDAQGEFHDQIRHGTDRRQQTIMHVSSTDPWHREGDQDEGVEQTGFDRVYQSGLTNGLPVMLPVGLIYDTPENAANEIRYLHSRGYKFDRVELGEEPDGQYITPEDFGALYLQWSAAIHRVDSDLKLGGPSFQEIIPDDPEDKIRLGNSEWMRRFLDYLERHGRARDYSFFSFEWYPFDEVCEPVAPQLARAPRMLSDALREMRQRGLSRHIPWIISEFGYSAYAARAELSIEGALLNADIVGKFLTLGGDQAFLFGYTPDYVGHDIPCTAGNNMLFSMDNDGDITHRFATYFGARMLMQEWLKPGDEEHEIYAASSDARDADGNELITAYVVHRPDGLWSLLLINKDPKRAYSVQISFRIAKKGRASGFAGEVDVFQYSGEQYQLNSDSNDSYPIKADEPDHKVVQSFHPKRTRVSLPPYSMTVVRGELNR